MIKHLKLPGWCLLVLALALSLNVVAQSAENYYGPTTSSGQVSHGVGTGVQAFSILTGGSFDGFTNGASVDNFVGPNALPGAQEIGGLVAPIFDSLKLNNGTGQFFNITNTAGIVVNGAVAYNNGITTTMRTNRTAGLAGAVKFLGNATYSPALAPASGVDAKFTDGYVTKVNPTAFVYPVGNVTDLRPITVTGTGTFSTAWSNSNVASFYTGALPFGTQGIATNGYWEWSGTAAATVTLSIPNESTFTTANKLSVMAYNGTAWTNLGGSFTTNTENSTNTTAVNVPATTVALAIGNTSASGVLVSPAVYLMGAMNTTAIMTQSLKTLNLIPKAQPYNTTLFIYAGAELLTTLPANMVDWILVDIRDSLTPTKIIATRAAILNKDGTVTDLDGVSPVTFSTVIPGNYFIGFRHRNHLAIRSVAKLALSSTTASIDFRTIAANAYTNPANKLNTAMKNMGSGRYAMWGGNANSNPTDRMTGAPNINDYLFFLNSGLGGSLTFITPPIYSNSDFNMNGVVRATGAAAINDYLFLLNNVLGGSTTSIITQHL